MPNYPNFQILKLQQLDTHYDPNSTGLDSIWARKGGGGVVALVLYMEFWWYANSDAGLFWAWKARIGNAVG